MQLWIRWGQMQRLGGFWLTENENSDTHQASHCDWASLPPGSPSSRVPAPSTGCCSHKFAQSGLLQPPPPCPWPPPERPANPKGSSEAPNSTLSSTSMEMLIGNGKSWCSHLDSLDLGFGCTQLKWLISANFENHCIYYIENVDPSHIRRLHIRLSCQVIWNLLWKRFLEFMLWLE